MSIYFDVVQESYELSDLSVEGEFWRQLDLSRLSANMPKCQRTLLDLGCGNGFYAAALRSRFERVILIDMSMAMLAAARQRVAGRSALNVICCDMVALPFALPATSTSAILCLGAAACYASRIEAAIAWVAAVLQPGGRAFLEFWNKTGLLLQASHGDERSSFAALAGACKDRKIDSIRSFAQTGHTQENSIAGHETGVVAYERNAIVALLRHFGLDTVRIFGRKVVSVLYDDEWIKRRIVDAPREVIAIEAGLAEEAAIIDLCPKFMVIAEKK